MSFIYLLNYYRIEVPRQGGGRKILWVANPFNDAARVSNENNVGDASASAPVAIATFVVIVVLVVLGFGFVLWCARRRRLKREAQGKEDMEQQPPTHVLVILPDDRLACGEVQLDEGEDDGSEHEQQQQKQEEEEEEEEGNRQE